MLYSVPLTCSFYFLSLSLHRFFSSCLLLSLALPLLLFFLLLCLSLIHELPNTNTSPPLNLVLFPSCASEKKEWYQDFSNLYKTYEVSWIMWVFKMPKKCGSAPAALSWNLHSRPQSARDQKDQVWERNRRILFQVRKHNMWIQSKREKKSQQRTDMLF